jgi:hypothetical protein
MSVAARALSCSAALFTLAIVVAAPRSAAAQAGTAKAKTGSLVIARDNASPAGGTIAKGERKLICRGAEIPAGFILIDDVKDKDQCGGENPAILNTNNVWVIEKHDAMPGGSIIDVCATAPIPKGWTLVDIYRDKAGCGHPSDLWAANVKRIRKG